MKKHLTMPVTANHVLQSNQFDQHETPTEDIFPAGAVRPWEETQYRKFSRETAVDKVRTVHADDLKAGQMVVDTHRVEDMRGGNHPGGVLEGRQLPDGKVMLRDGHHRAAADLLDGKRRFKVHIDTAWHAT